MLPLKDNINWEEKIYLSIKDYIQFVDEKIKQHEMNTFVCRELQNSKYRKWKGVIKRYVFLFVCFLNINSVYLYFSVEGFVIMQ